MRYHLDPEPDPLTLWRWQLRDVAKARVDHQALVVYLTVQALAREGRTVEPHLVAAALRYTTETVVACLATLQARGWIEHHPDADRPASLPSLPPNPKNTPQLAAAAAGPDQSGVGDQSSGQPQKSVGSAHAEPLTPARAQGALMHPGEDSRPQGSGGGSVSEYKFPRGKSTTIPEDQEEGHAGRFAGTLGRSNVERGHAGPSPDADRGVTKRRQRRARPSAASNDPKQDPLWPSLTGADVPDQGPVDEDGIPLFVGELADALLRDYPHGKSEGGRSRRPGRTEVIRALRPALHGKKEPRRSEMCALIVRACRMEAEAVKREGTAPQFVKALDVWVRKRRWETLPEFDGGKGQQAAAEAATDRVAATKDYLSREKGYKPAAPADPAKVAEAAARWKQRMGGDGGEA